VNRVYLVGAGPGDPELLTVKALFLLRRANVVLHDSLVTPEILGLISSQAAVIDVGKRCGQKLLAQDDINNLLVQWGARVETTVRLKGGDPSLFGRAGEEIQALRDAGIDYEIVPGITSALAGAAAAGFSLTDRRFASSVVFTTAHRGAGVEAVEWDRLVASHSTLVIYMPGRDYGELRQQLCDAGLSSQTPCTIVSSAGRSTQNIQSTSLKELGEHASLPSPSILIVGRCCSGIPELYSLQPGEKLHEHYTSNSLGKEEVCLQNVPDDSSASICH